MKRETSFIAQLYVFVWLLVLPIGAYAQGNKVSLKCSNMALTSALLEVEKQSGYYKINYNSGGIVGLQGYSDYPKPYSACSCKPPTDRFAFFGNLQW